RLLEEYGIPYPPYGLAKTPEEAAELASKIGFPVVLKVVSPDISHKTDVGGVILGVSSVEEVVEGFEKIMKNVKSRVQGARVNGILVQKMVPRGVEVIVGGLRDYTFGVAVMFGLGGVFTEVFKDVTFRIWPFTLEEALEMVNEIRSATILKGFRDTPPVDVYSVADILVKLGKLLNEHSEIESADLNPVVVYPDRALVVDARFIVGASKG
ncbi:MAG: acetate--CoA ligase family protein, partial [Desulfurococcaceae archaeon]